MRSEVSDVGVCWFVCFAVAISPQSYLFIKHFQAPSPYSSCGPEERTIGIHASGERERSSGMTEGKWFWG